VLLPPATPSTVHVTFELATPLMNACSCEVCPGVTEICTGTIDTVLVVAVPVPVKFTVCWVDGSLSLNVTNPSLVPAAEGVNVTCRVQLAPAATDDPQVFVCAKSPLATMLTTLSGAPPVFFKVSVCDELVEKTFCEAKVRLVGVNTASGPPLVPVPVSATDCGLPVALSATEIAAVRVPAASGVKVTLIVQFAPLATDVPQLLVCEKSAEFVPVTEMLETVNVLLPVLNRVIPLTGLDVPTACAWNVRVEVLKLMPELFPVPVKVTNCGLPVASSATESVA
jgi:hypothetical protein